jgi:hypothetical protein
MSVRLYVSAGRVEGDLSGPERLGPITWRDDHEEVRPLPEADGPGQPGRPSGRFLASLPCRRPVDWPTSMRYPSGSRM